MLIVIATGEPRGAYHLEPLYGSMESSPSNYTHLLPYPEPVQGRAWSNVSSDPSIINRANLVVITGGGFTAWSELVALRSENLNIPWVVSELAYGSQPDAATHPYPKALSSMSLAGAELFAAYHHFNLDEVVITGTPLLDNLPIWRPVVKRALILSSADAAIRDPSGVLKTIAHRLVNDGWQVFVRTHPREDQSAWRGFTLDNSPTPAIAASSAEVVIGYPGSAHPICAAIGVPTVAVTPTSDLLFALPPSHRTVIPTWIKSFDELDLNFLNASSPSTVEYVCGPIGGSAQRVVDFWISQARY